VLVDYTTRKIWAATTLMQDAPTPSEGSADEAPRRWESVVYKPRRWMILG
jgi:hypothetical protein